MGGPCSGDPIRTLLRTCCPPPSRQGARAGRLSWVTLYPACKCHRHPPPLPTQDTGQNVRPQSGSARAVCAGAAGVAAPTDRRMDGQTAVPLLATDSLLAALFSCSGYGRVSPALLPSASRSTSIREMQTCGCWRWGAALFAGQLCPVKPAAGTKRQPLAPEFPSM